MASTRREADGEDADTAPFAEGASALAFLSADARKELEKVDPRDRAKIVATIKKQYVENGPGGISIQKLNTNEGRHRVGKGEKMLWAFKGHQARLYGVEGNCGGKRAFFGTHAAVKKTDRADPNALTRAAERVLDFVDRIPSASVG